ncbi:hypothetical protein T492DRAFT_835331 [Pavlovales sp. CCMP2436]|nr:hypothetical protein T492DRAFT_835331 [Pavlovales sp. CCMP2436]
MAQPPREFVRAKPQLHAHATLSSSLALERTALKLANDTREQYPVRKLPTETAHTAGVFDSRWTDAELEAVHARELLRYAEVELARLVAKPSTEGAMARRVALRNPQHALSAASASSQIRRALDDVTRDKRRARTAQAGQGMRGLLVRDVHSLEASAMGRTHSQLRIRLKSSGSLLSRQASRHAQRAPASPSGSSGVFLQSAAKLMLGGGQLSSVSIPSKLYMGSNGSEVDYIALERR